jgi:hypothetical protein
MRVMVKTGKLQVPHRLKVSVSRFITAEARLPILTCLLGRVGKADVADPPWTLTLPYLTLIDRRKRAASLNLGLNQESSCS